MAQPTLRSNLLNIRKKIVVTLIVLIMWKTDVLVNKYNRLHATPYSAMNIR